MQCIYAKLLCRNYMLTCCLLAPTELIKWWPEDQLCQSELFICCAGGEHFIWQCVIQAIFSRKEQSLTSTANCISLTYTNLCLLLILSILHHLLLLVFCLLLKLCNFVCCIAIIILYLIYALFAWQALHFGTWLYPEVLILCPGTRPVWYRRDAMLLAMTHALLLS